MNHPPLVITPKYLVVTKATGAEQRLAGLSNLLNPNDLLYAKTAIRQLGRYEDSRYIITDSCPTPNLPMKHPSKPANRRTRQAAKRTAAPKAAIAGLVADAEQACAALSGVPVRPDYQSLLADLVQAHDLKMGPKAIKLRIERARDAIQSINPNT